MSEIKILELPAAGSELFKDPESFLDELSDQALKGIEGGGIVSQTLESLFITRKNVSIGNSNNNTGNTVTLAISLVTNSHVTA
jgi:hypothetical protein